MNSDIRRRAQAGESLGRGDGEIRAPQSDSDGEDEAPKPIKRGMQGVVTYCALAFAVFGCVFLFYIMTDRQPVTQCPFEVVGDGTGVATQRETTPTIVFGNILDDPAIERAEGKTAIFQNGFSIGAFHQFEVDKLDRSKVTLKYKNGTVETTLAVFAGRDVILGEAPFNGAKGNGDVYLSGTPVSGVFEYWQQQSVTMFDDGTAAYRVVHTQVPGLNGLQLVPPGEKVGIVIARDGLVYVGPVDSKLRNANKNNSTVIVGGKLSVQEVYKNTSFDCVRVQAPSATRLPTLLRYSGTCGSYSTIVSACVFSPISTMNGPASSKVDACNLDAITQYSGLENVVSFKAVGSCGIDSLPTIYGYDSSNQEIFKYDMTSEAACQESSYHWVCVPQQPI
jgi:hypothetical protein